MLWSPSQYEKFGDERAQPFHDLMAMVRFEPGMRIVDLGCGTGKLTALLHAASPGSVGEGVDSSPAMIERARELGGGGVTFVLGDLAHYGEPGAYDLVFSNAALHWLDDHPRLVGDLAKLAKRGGQIAWQVPSNHRHPAHELIHRVLVAEEPYRTMLGGYVRQATVLEVDEYARALYGIGAKQIEAMERVYVHELQSVAQVAEWTKATTLLPYLERLPDAVHGAFLERYRELLEERWGGGRPYGYTFRRILLHAWV